LLECNWYDFTGLDRSLCYIIVLFARRRNSLFT